MRGLAGRTALVTGGGNGIGAAICRRFAEEGARVAVCDRDGEAAEAVAGDIGGAAHRMDITDRAQVARTVAAIGPVDALVNNAGGRSTPRTRN